MRFYVIEGNIGAGKTSLVSLLSEKYKAKAVFEQFADNPFLPKFYKEPDKYAFPLELAFLADRYAQLKKELNPDLFSPFVIADYYFPKSLIFARKTLADDEYNLYNKLFNIILNQLPKPTVYVYLHQNTTKLLENIRQRGRDYEQNITETYLKDIQESYFNYFSHQESFPVLIFECDKIDFVHNPDNLAFLESKILNEKFSTGVHYIIP